MDHDEVVLLPHLPETPQNAQISSDHQHTTFQRFLDVDSEFHTPNQTWRIFVGTLDFGILSQTFVVHVIAECSTPSETATIQWWRYSLFRAELLKLLQIIYLMWKQWNSKRKYKSNKQPKGNHYCCLASWKESTQQLPLICSTKCYLAYLLFMMLIVLDTPAQIS